MATPNGWNPTYNGLVTAGGFTMSHGNGILATVAVCTGTTPVNVLGSTVNFYGQVTGVLVVTLGATGKVITLAATGGTVAGVTTASTFGQVSGSPVTAVSLTPSSTLTIASASASDTSLVYVFYKVTNV